LCRPGAGPGLGWAVMNRKVYEVDPLLCPSCGGHVSFIEDHRVFDRIIHHLELILNMLDTSHQWTPILLALNAQHQRRRVAPSVKCCC